MKNNLIFSNNFLWPRQTNWLTFYTHLFQTVYKLVFKSTTNQSQYLINQTNKRVSWGSFSKKLINCQPKKPLPKVSHSWSFFEVLIQICGHQNLPYFSIHSSLKSFFFFQKSGCLSWKNGGRLCWSRHENLVIRNSQCCNSYVETNVVFACFMLQ